MGWKVGLAPFFADAQWLGLQTCCNMHCRAKPTVCAFPLQRRHTPPSTVLTPAFPVMICCNHLTNHLLISTAEEAHATQYGPYATMPPEQRTDSRYFAAAHMLEEAWAW